MSVAELVILKQLVKMSLKHKKKKKESRISVNKIALNTFHWRSGALVLDHMIRYHEIL